MAKMKIYFIYIITILCVFQSSYSSITYENVEGDRELAKNRSLISDVDLEVLHSTPPKAAITVGYKDLGGGVKHAYLVFETPIIENGEPKIHLQGVHLGRGSGYYAPDSLSGIIYGGGTGKIICETAEDVLMKFVRAKEITTKIKEDDDGVDRILGSEIKILDASYTKYKSFIVSLDNTKKALQTMKDDINGGIYFSLRGWGYSNKEKTHNCTSYVIRLLKKSGVEIMSSGRTDYKIDHNYLARRIKRYEKKSQGARKGVEVITPHSAQALLTRYGIN